MNLLLEDAIKQRLSSRGVEIPDGGVAATPLEVREIATRLGGRCVVKALIGIGDRGRKGLVVEADDPTAAEDAAAALLGSTYDYDVVRRVLVESAIAPGDDYYLSCAIDCVRAEAVLMWGAGGSGVEERVAPQRRVVDLEGMELGDVGLPEALRDVGAAIFAEFVQTGARFIETNPVRLVGGRCVVLDGKAVLDPYLDPPDDAFEVSHGASKPAEPDALESSSRSDGAAGGSTLRFIRLDGDIGLVMWGGGATLVIMDSLSALGLRPANYTDMGAGRGMDERRIELTERVLGDKPRGVLMASMLLDGPVTPLARMWRDALERFGYVGGGVPVVVRLAGGEEDAARALLDLPDITFLGSEATLDEAVATLHERLSDEAAR